MTDAFDLATTYIHLGHGATAVPLEGFEWSQSYLQGYEERFADDGAEGRLVSLIPQEETWTQWERHPAGEEVVVLLSGRVDVIQELNGKEHTVELRPGHAMVNPAGAWHRAIVHERGTGLFITPGIGTETRPLG